MRSSRLEVVTTPRAGLAVSQGRRSLWPAFLAGLALTGLAAAGSWLAHQRVERFLSDLDAKALERGAQSFERALKQQQAFLLAEVSVLAEDTRVRAPVMTPTLDEATLRDILQDIMRAGGASMLAVLDVKGKVRAVTGVEGLREVDLGSSPVVKAALEKPSTDVWSLPDRALVVGVAAVRSGPDVVALLVMGLEIGEPFLAPIHRALGVAGAVLVRDRVVARSSTDPALVPVFAAANGLEEDRVGLVPGFPYVARVQRTGRSASAGKVTWLVGRHHEVGRDNPFPVAVWTPTIMVGLTFALVLALSRRSQGSS